MHRDFLKYSTGKLTQYEERIETCLDKLTYDQIWARDTDKQNAVGNLVLHLCGNLGQWILSGVAGAPDLRDRDAEFAARGDVSASELKTRLRDRVNETVAVIQSLTPEQLVELTVVQGYEVSKLHAVYHVVSHFSEHAGQIIFATKLFTSDDLGFYRHLANPLHGSTLP
ncbi:MAG: DUF1572 family protein [Bryobacteraceae bacterium]